MTFRLVLTRHAKSDWDNPLETDHQRKLNARGRRSAPLIGRWLAQKGYLPQEALVSDATRTRETFALLCADWPTLPVRFEPALYHACPDVMLRALRTAKAQTVLMIGHNPGIASFAALLLQRAYVHPTFDRYPTCATLVAEFDAASWADVNYATGAALDFVVPRELE
ncbi:SixA phosphatase family protein [Roseinatronobacter monicus]|uniref:SixA phosphatase family protein n=1 Tax=Roseinatronobacter monicus TaxID=393481 RepID=UPI003F3E4ACA